MLTACGVSFQVFLCQHLEGETQGAEGTLVCADGVAQSEVAILALLQNAVVACIHMFPQVPTAKESPGTMLTTVLFLHHMHSPDVHDTVDFLGEHLLAASANERFFVFLVEVV